MSRDWAYERDQRVAFIQSVLKSSGAKGIVFGNSGGKDCCLVGILCRLATPNVTGVIMPCSSSRNFGIDRDHALLMSKQFDVNAVEVDLTQIKNQFTQALSPLSDLNGPAGMNINPRLRMTTLYALAQSKGCLVAGTGNRSERYMGYFTKWGDGAFDFNPISDLTATEIFSFLRFLHAPQEIIEKAPSAGLFEGQTDEKEMGVTYAAIDEYILHGTGTPENIAIIKRAHEATSHKRRPAQVYAACPEDK
ncbi:MAG: NAD(+) synthase [Christensenellales bacterium]